jgi:hypothetical protein
VRAAPQRLTHDFIDILAGRAIDHELALGVLAGTVLFTFAIVLILFRRGFGLDIPNSIHWIW